MALLNLESMINRVEKELKGLTNNTGFEILSYKRNRGVSVLKIDDDNFIIREKGYCDEEKTISRPEIIKILENIIKREFPRSRKLRIYSISAPEDLHKTRKKL
jgi:hypothetical protein